MMFLATGLVNNSGYLDWGQIRNIASSGLVTFANHTWSHKNIGSAANLLENEIGTAQIQLEDHGVGKPKIFAYP